MPYIRHFKSQTYHDFDRYRLLHKSLRRAIILLPFSVSGADDKPVIALGKTFISIAIHDDAFRVQLAVTRNIVFPVVLGINFLQTHGGIISF